MYATMQGVSPWVWLYFLPLVAFGSFFLVNLALAVLYLQFTKDTPLPREGGTSGRGALAPESPGAASVAAGGPAAAGALLGSSGRDIGGGWSRSAGLGLRLSGSSGGENMQPAEEGDYTGTTEAHVTVRRADALAPGGVPSAVARILREQLSGCLQWPRRLAVQRRHVAALPPVQRTDPPGACSA